MLFYTQDKTIDEHFFFTIFISSMSHKINIYNFYSKLQNKKRKRENPLIRDMIQNLDMSFVNWHFLLTINFLMLHRDTGMWLLCVLRFLFWKLLISDSVLFMLAIYFCIFAAKLILLTIHRWYILWLEKLVNTQKTPHCWVHR